MKTNRIDIMFAENKKKNRKAFIPFLTAGDPDLETTKAIIIDMAHSGADLIEIGIPFSDPMAEGPVIQRANIRGLESKTTVDSVMKMVKELRETIDTPLVYLTYFNVVFAYGLDAFFKACAEVGIDGIIIPDLPVEESDEIAEYTKKYNVYHILMIAPTSDERMEIICNKARGFLYCVSSLGVTGMRSEFVTDFGAMFSDINRVSDIPKCIGFGISNPEQAKELKQYCDGVIVGSAIVKEIEDGKTMQEKVQAVHQLMASFRKALD